MGGSKNDAVPWPDKELLQNYFIGFIEYLEGFNVDGREEGAEKEKGASSATHVSLSEKYRISGAK